MLQATRAQRNQALVTVAFVAGMADNQLAQVILASQQLGIQIVKFDLQHVVRLTKQAASNRVPFDPGSYLFNLGNLVRVHG
jgi:hypothetical protein